AATATTFGLARRARSPERALLAGVAVGFFFSGLIMAQQYLASPAKAYAAIRWTVGGVELCEGRYLAVIGATLGLAVVVLGPRARELDALALGDDAAKSLGIEVERFRLQLFALTSALVAAIVAFCGPIGFVGLATPRIARLIVGGEHRRLIPATIFGGAIFLGACHTISRIVIFPSVLPVGIVTGVPGGAFFIWILLRKTD
ncbi:MAG: iron ABC transporter permease, partial [Thermoguttaceae bacterium]|nr:iron ABC transporter permease [Thermoguttaceae bacterium]